MELAASFEDADVTPYKVLFLGAVEDHRTVRSWLSRYLPGVVRASDSESDSFCVVQYQVLGVSRTVQFLSPSHAASAALFSTWYDWADGYVLCLSVQSCRCMSRSLPASSGAGKEKAEAEEEGDAVEERGAGGNMGGDDDDDDDKGVDDAFAQEDVDDVMSDTSDGPLLGFDGESVDESMVSEEAKASSEGVTPRLTESAPASFESGVVERIAALTMKPKRASFSRRFRRSRELESVGEEEADDAMLAAEERTKPALVRTATSEDKLSMMGRSKKNLLLGTVAEMEANRREAEKQQATVSAPQEQRKKKRTSSCQCLRRWKKILRAVKRRSPSLLFVPASECYVPLTIVLLNRAGHEVDFSEPVEDEQIDPVRRFCGAIKCLADDENAGIVVLNKSDLESDEAISAHSSSGDIAPIPISKVALSPPSSLGSEDAEAAATTDPSVLFELCVGAIDWERGGADTSERRDTLQRMRKLISDPMQMQLLNSSVVFRDAFYLWLHLNSFLSATTDEERERVMAVLMRYYDDQHKFPYFYARTRAILNGMWARAKRESAVSRLHDEVLPELRRALDNLNGVSSPIVVQKISTLTVRTRSASYLEETLILESNNYVVLTKLLNLVHQNRCDNHVGPPIRKKPALLLQKSAEVLKLKGEGRSMRSGRKTQREAFDPRAMIPLMQSLDAVMRAHFIEHEFGQYLVECCFDDQAEVFREDDSSTTFLSYCFFRSSAGFIASVLRKPVEKLAAEMGNDSGVEQSFEEQLLFRTHPFLVAILSSAANFPLDFRLVLRRVASLCRVRSLPYHVILSRLVLLRWMVPAIVSPARYGVVAEGSLSGEARRALVEVGKVLIQISRGEEFSGNHVANAYIRSNVVPVQRFLEKLVDASHLSASMTAAGKHRIKDRNRLLKDRSFGQHLENIRLYLGYYKSDIVRALRKKSIAKLDWQKLTRK